jgi:hypothetical protein
MPDGAATARLYYDLFAEFLREFSVLGGFPEWRPTLWTNSHALNPGRSKKARCAEVKNPGRPWMRLHTRSGFFADEADPI